jgi:hypothetical protein
VQACGLARATVVDRSQFADGEAQTDVDRECRIAKSKVPRFINRQCTAGRFVVARLRSKSLIRSNRAGRTSPLNSKED